MVLIDWACPHQTYKREKCSEVPWVEVPGDKVPEDEVPEDEVPEDEKMEGECPNPLNDDDEPQ